MTNKPILSICIPIYNRLDFLEKQLSRFSEDSDLFDEQIQLIVSDNCSTQDIESCCARYREKGLRVQYHRNEMNLGPDGNFEWCFFHSLGKYVWLLGSDDIPLKGLLRAVVAILEKGDYGLVNLSMKKKPMELVVFHSSDQMLIAVNYWVTYISTNIIRTDSLKELDLSEYRESLMIQVPAYINAICSYRDNAVFYTPKVFESESDKSYSVGYNYFQVFVTNFFSILDNYVKKGKMSENTFNQIAKIEYRELLLSHIVNQLILRRGGTHSVDGAISRLWKFYGRKPYAYYYLACGLLKTFARFVSWPVRKIYRLFRLRSNR